MSEECAKRHPHSSQILSAYWKDLKRSMLWLIKTPPAQVLSIAKLIINAEISTDLMKETFPNQHNLMDRPWALNTETLSLREHALFLTFLNNGFEILCPAILGMTSTLWVASKELEGIHFTTPVTISNQPLRNWSVESCRILALREYH